MPGASEVMAPQQPSRIDENAILFAAIDSIIPNPRQPRRIFREEDPKLLELSASIKEHGLLQPIIVTRLDSLEALSGRKKASTDPWMTQDALEGDPVSRDSRDVSHVVQFQIIAGERRWRASRLAGLTKV